MTTPKPDLFLITGIPGTGKTCYGDKFASQFGFAHYDLEESETLNRCAPNPDQFIDELLKTERSIVVTWGFVPNHQYSVSTVCKFRERGFELMWLDSNRPAALREFQKRGTVPEELFYLQMYRIEASKVIEAIKPVIINPFDAQGDFKSPAVLLDEMRQK